MIRDLHEEAVKNSPNTKSPVRQSLTHIRPARRSDIKSIVDVHMSSFPRFFLTNLGRLFLRAYYSFVLDYQDHLFFVIERDSRLMGFAAGFTDPARFYKSMAAKSYRFFIPTFLSMIRHPILLRRIWRHIHKIIFIRQIPDFRSESACELSSLAVDPKYTGQGLGKKLMEEFIEVAKILRIKEIRLTTDAQDNDQVNAFYRNLGFKLYRTCLAFDVRPMNEYVLDTTSV